MPRVIKKILWLFILIPVLCPVPSFAVAWDDIGNDSFYKDTSLLTDKQIQEIEDIVMEQKDKGKVPGMSVVVVKGDQVAFYKGYGYADVGSERPVTANTLFELGSNSKSFTGLGILKLKKQGRVQMEDPIRNYLPWFKATYRGKEVDITVEQLLHHTSGIEFKNISKIPPSQDDHALEEAVRSLSGTKLAYQPGVRYSYSTVNYDILGLIIEKVSGQKFEDFMKENILKPFGLNHTYLFREEAMKHDMASGYKYGFGTTFKYEAPVFRGNTPAGYYITNAKDIAKWLMIQLGTEKNISKIDQEIIKESHIPNRAVGPTAYMSSYAVGWHVFQSGTGELAHTGANPNYFTYIVFRPEDKLGVAVLSNIYSYTVENAGQGIMDTLSGNPKERFLPDSNQKADHAPFAILCVTVPFIIVLLFFWIKAIVQLFRKQRKFKGIGTKSLLKVLLSMVFLTAFMASLYYLPKILTNFMNFTWYYVKIFGPLSLMPAIIGVLVAGCLAYLYILFVHFFPKENEKPMILLVIFSIISGFGNAFIILIINNAIMYYRNYDFIRGFYKFPMPLFLYFIFAITVYVCGQKVIRTKLVNIVNHQVYEKRKKLIEKIIGTAYYKFEAIENGKIHACLNNDTEVISRFAGAFINAATGFVTLVCCFVYLGLMSLYGLLISICVIFLAGGIYFFVGKYSNKVWEQTRDIQNIFFGFIDHLVYGFKELNIHRKKRDEFKQDMLSSLAQYRDKRILGELKFANAFVIGELLFTAVIGVVAFLFPVFIYRIESSTLSNFIFVYLYMNGPVYSILNAVPELIQVRISWNRIRDFSEEISILSQEEPEKVPSWMKGDTINLTLKGVEFSYNKKNGEVFSVGPVNYQFNSGEIVFITGGNGSGKSTLAKIVTGLYVPHKGEILMNGKKIDTQALGQHVSAVFSDFHLFDKLYGIDMQKKKDEIQKYLKLLKMEDKVQVTKDGFSSTKLSTGQRKRLALLISYLEDRPVCLLDEWAADQDPGFRKFFYEVLLPQMKQKGKCVIAITHDDRYFDVADKVIKMEMGKVVGYEEHPIVSEVTLMNA